MGKFSNSVQTMQLEKRRHDSGGGWDGSVVRAKIERGINNYLMDCYILRDINIASEEGLERYGVDPKIFNLIYPNWQIVKVGEDGVYVGF